MLCRPRCFRNLNKISNAKDREAELIARLHSYDRVWAGEYPSEAEIARRGAFIFIPEQWDLTSYKTLWSSRQNLIRAYGNTLFRVIVGTSMNLAFTIALAYPLSKRNLKGRTAINALVFFTMIFSGGMVPTYMMVKWTGLINTRWALILPGAMSVYNSIICRTAIEAVPDSLEESAHIDGANDLVICFRIILPLIMPTIAVLLLYYGVGHWNSYFSALIYISDPDKYPLQLVLRNILITNEAALSQAATSAAAREALREKQQLIDVMKYSLIIISSVPVLILYPFIQKHFVKGVMIGSVKG